MRSIQFRKESIFYCCLFLLMILTGCTKKSVIGTSIINSPCEPPCWQNISPGVTYRDEVYSLLMEVPGVDKEKAGWHGRWNTYDDLLHWKAEDSKVDGEIYIVDEYVSKIVLYGDLGLSLEEALYLFGEPDEMLIHRTYKAGRFGGSVLIEMINLTYAEKGVIIMFENQGGLNPIQISPNDHIKAILYFAPGNISETISKSIFPYDELIKSNRVFSWKGYTEFELEQ